MVKWRKSPRDKIKFDWDAAFDQQKGQIGMGPIIRNHKGIVLETVRIYISFRSNAFTTSFRSNAFTTESLNLFNTIKFYLTTGYGDLIVEGDAKQVVDTI